MIKLNCVTINSLGGTKTGITQVDADDVASGKLCMTINTTTVMTGIFLRMLKDGMQNVVVEAIGQDTKKRS